jgi:hypothetical protein
MRKVVLLAALGMIAGCGGSPAVTCQTAPCGSGARTYQVCVNVNGSETWNFGGQSCTAPSGSSSLVQTCADEIANYCDGGAGGTSGGGGTSGTGGSGTGGSGTGGSGTGGSGTGGSGGSGVTACTYTVSGAQAGTGTCTVMAALTADSNGVALVISGGQSFEFAATLSGETTLTRGTYTNADAAPGFGAEYLVGVTGAYVLCSTSDNCSDAQGDAVPAQGSFSLAVTDPGPAQTVGSATLWATPQGTLTVTMPAQPGGAETGTVMVVVTL